MKKDTLYEKHLNAIETTKYDSTWKSTAKASTSISIEYAKEECLEVLNFIYNNERLFSDSGDPNEIYEEYIKSILP